MNSQAIKTKHKLAQPNFKLFPQCNCGAPIIHKTLLSRGGECKPVKSFAGLSKACKSHIYRKASLQPRASDVDFAPGETVDTVDAADADSGACSSVVRLTHEAVLYQNVGALSCE